MTTTMIPDEERIDVADLVTVWVATQHAPADVWSLREAVLWTMQQSHRDNITLFRPPGCGAKAAWLSFKQIERLALVLAGTSVGSAA